MRPCLPLMLLPAFCAKEPDKVNMTAISCQLRQLANATAAARLGFVAAEVADALRLEQDCNDQPAFIPLEKVLRPGSQVPLSPEAVFVATDGNDETGDGSSASPFATPHRARDAARALPTPRAVVMHGGTYHLGAVGPLILTGEDSGTSWQAALGEVPVLSGTASLGTPTWQPWPGHEPILRAQVKDPVASRGFQTLFGSNGRRLVRARVPNADPETTGGLCFMYGREVAGEGCSAYFSEPTASTGQFNGTRIRSIRFPVPKGGLVPGDDYASTYKVSFQSPPENLAAEGFPDVAGNLYDGRSSGIVWSNFTNKNWSSPETGVVHMMDTKRWGNHQFTVKSVDQPKKELHFERGGWQNSKPYTLGSFYVENILEELDSPGEWFFDEKHEMLYLWPNSTDSFGELSAAVLESVLVVNGSQAAPVQDVSFTGLVFASTAPTFLRPYEQPPSGDWSLHRGAAVFVEGAKNVSFSKSRFIDAGGNALMFSGFAKNCTVQDSEFLRSGDSAVLAFGKINAETGDGTADDYPSGLLVQRNHMHEIGVWGKQTSCFFQGISGNNIFEDNVCYNSPRALVNLNDGFLGLTQVRRNVLFNSCRESKDHGPFNSWDRTPMKFREKDSWGEETWTPGMTHVAQNLILSTYGSSHNIDHDDGSEYYNSSSNVVAFAESCKGNFGSHRLCNKNLILFPGGKMYSPESGPGGGHCASQANNGEGSSYADQHFEGNVCATPGGEAYSFYGCSTPERNFNATCWGTRNNRFLVPDGASVHVNCGGEKVPLEEWRDEYGQDAGARVDVLPAPEELVAMAKEVLGLSDGAVVSELWV